MTTRLFILKIYKGLVRKFTGYGLIKLYPVRVVYTFINSLLIPKYAIVDGHKIFLDSQDSLNFSSGENYKPTETEVFKKEISLGNTVLDIGANIGDDTLVLAKLVGNRGRIYAFEPDPDNFRLLKKNVLVNKYKNVVLINKAVSDKNGIIKLFLSDNNKADHRIYDPENKRKYVEVGMISLDSYFKSKRTKIDVVKIDIQGAEMLAFKGMKRLLKNNKNCKILTEFWPIGLKRAGSSAKECLSFIRGMGYSISYLDEKKSQVIKVSDNYLLKNFTEKKENFANLICIKTNR